MPPTTPKPKSRWPQKLVIYAVVGLLFVLPRDAGAGEPTAAPLMPFIL